MIFGTICIYVFCNAYPYTLAPRINQYFREQWFHESKIYRYIGRVSPLHKLGWDLSWVESWLSKSNIVPFLLVTIHQQNCICYHSLQYGLTLSLGWLKNTMTSSNGNIFLRVTGHLCGEFTAHRWIPHTKPYDAELWCFLWSTFG